MQVHNRMEEYLQWVCVEPQSSSSGPLLPRGPRSVAFFLTQNGQKMKRYATLAMLLGILLLGACAANDTYNSQSTPRSRSSHQH